MAVNRFADRPRSPPVSGKMGNTAKSVREFHRFNSDLKKEKEGWRCNIKTVTKNEVQYGRGADKLAAKHYTRTH